MSLYIDEFMEQEHAEKETSQLDATFDVDYARHGLRYIIETIGKVADGAVV